MEIAITKMSQNGQIVIPSEIRKDAGIIPFTKFIVLNRNGDILLRQITKQRLQNEEKIIEMIQHSEKMITEGKFRKANTKMSENEIDDLLMA
jgi:AbrB family looped-hinge helix DNA binding protein